MAETAAEGTLLEKAMTLIDAASQRGIALRLVGGLAIQVLTPRLPPRTRTGQDLDFASAGKTRKDLSAMLAERGYVADKNFNALYGDKQLYFAHGETGLAIDVLIDKLRMCHTLEFADRMMLMPHTLDPLDLLLSKLQIFELNEKDADDCLRLLISFPVGDDSHPDALDLGPFRDLVGNDWGWWKTVTLNLERIEHQLTAERHPVIAHRSFDPREQLAKLAQAAEDAPKSRGWKLRAKIGERKRWYELPEETPHH
jgi:hypothetical protein